MSVSLITNHLSLNCGDKILWRDPSLLPDWCNWVSISLLCHRATWPRTSYIALASRRVLIAGVTWPPVGHGLITLCETCGDPCKHRVWHHKSPVMGITAWDLLVWFLLISQTAREREREREREGLICLLYLFFCHVTAWLNRLNFVLVLTKLYWWTTNIEEWNHRDEKVQRFHINPTKHSIL